MNPKQARARMGLTQTELAHIMGVHHVTVSTWERKARTPENTAETLLNLLVWLSENRPKIFEMWRKVLLTLNPARMLWAAIIF